MDITFRTTSHQSVTVDNEAIASVVRDEESDDFGTYAYLRLHDGTEYLLSQSGYRDLPLEVRSLRPSHKR